MSLRFVKVISLSSYSFALSCADCRFQDSLLLEVAIPSPPCVPASFGEYETGCLAGRLD